MRLMSPERTTSSTAAGKSRCACRLLRHIADAVAPQAVANAYLPALWAHEAEHGAHQRRFSRAVAAEHHGIFAPPQGKADMFPRRRGPQRPPSRPERHQRHVLPLPSDNPCTSRPARIRADQRGSRVRHRGARRVGRPLHNRHETYCRSASTRHGSGARIRRRRHDTDSAKCRARPDSGRAVCWRQRDSRKR